MARCTIDEDTYQELKTLIERFAKSSPQNINFWVNLVCQVGLAALKNNKADFSKIIAGRSPEEWFYENNVTLLPVPSRTPGTTPQEQPSSQISVPAEGGKRRKSNYNPEEYTKILKNLDG